MNGVTLQAPIVAQRKDAVLYRIDGGPLQLQDALVGRETDGWMIGSSEEPGRTRVVHALRRLRGRARARRRPAARGSAGARSPALATTGKVTVRIGPVGIGPDKQPRIEHVTETRRFDVPDCEANGDDAQPAERPVAHGDHASRRPSSRRRSTRRRASAGDSGAVIERAGFQPLFGS